MVQLAGGFAGRGHRVDLVLARAEGAFLADIPDEVNLIDLGVEGAAPAFPILLRRPRTAWALAPALLTGLPWVFGAVPELVRYLETQRPEALISALDYTNFSALLAAGISRELTPTIVIEQNTVSARARGIAHWRWRFLPRMIRHFYPDAAALTAVSRGVATDLATLAGLHERDVRTIFNPIVSQATAADSKLPLDHPWFAEGQPPVILGVGKLKLQKDFTTLLRAFARIRALRPVRLVILGEGPDRERLLREARQLGVAADFELPGFVPNPFRFMARAAVFALSSAWEGLPSVLVEAMACGCAVVSTRCPSGPDEILEQGAYGRLVAVGDDRAFADALAASLDEVPDRARLRERAAHFSVTRAVDG
ncbi:MAG: glycosyltransferase [Deltaproteobacteria bacterium]|nr:glycosyltransferase [Deltaproteobacteria bacterium]